MSSRLDEDYIRITVSLIYIRPTVVGLPRRARKGTSRSPLDSRPSVNKHRHSSAKKTANPLCSFPFFLSLYEEEEFFFYPFLFFNIILDLCSCLYIQLLLAVIICSAPSAIPLAGR